MLAIKKQRRGGDEGGVGAVKIATVTGWQPVPRDLILRLTLMCRWIAVALLSSKKGVTYE
jgi:hypothetical protein